MQDYSGLMRISLRIIAPPCASPYSPGLRLFSHLIPHGFDDSVNAKVFSPVLPFFLKERQSPFGDD